MCPEQVVTLTLVGNIESIESSATPDHNLDKILPAQSIPDDYRHLQAELLQNNPHTHDTKLEMKVQDGSVSDQQSGHLHRTLREHCHLQ
jgi:hypothetical protein